MSKSTIHSTALIGYSAMTQKTIESSVSFGINFVVSPFAVIGIHTHFGDNVFIDIYSRVGDYSKIGKNTRIINGARVNENVQIGEECIVSGSVTERTIIEDNVRTFGSIVHTQRNPSSDWLSTEEPSAKLREGSFVGAGSVIIGDLEIGRYSYIAAGEIVRSSVPDNHLFYKGRSFKREDWKGGLNNSFIN